MCEADFCCDEGAWLAAHDDYERHGNEFRTPPKPKTTLGEKERLKQRVCNQRNEIAALQEKLTGKNKEIERMGLLEMECDNTQLELSNLRLEYESCQALLKNAQDRRYMPDWGLPYKMAMYEVDLSTVGQYTGLTDILWVLRTEHQMQNSRITTMILIGSTAKPANRQ